MYTDGLIEGAHRRAATNGSTSTGCAGCCAEPAAPRVPLAALPAWLVGRAEQAQRRPARRRRRDAADLPGRWPVSAASTHRGPGPCAAGSPRCCAHGRRAAQRCSACSPRSPRAATATGTARHDAQQDRPAARPPGEQLSTALVDQETGVRGYALSGGPANLGPYTRGLEPRSSAGRRDRRACSADEPRRSGPQLRARSARGRPPGAPRSPSRSSTAVPRPGPEAGQALSTAAAADRFDAAARGRSRSCRTTILTLRDAAAADAPSDQQPAWWRCSIAAAVVVILAGARCWSLLLDRLVSRPVIELAEQVRAGRRRRLRHGDHQRRARPSWTGWPRTSTAMRRQIAAELTEVREARAPGRVGQRAAAAAGRGADPVQPRPGAVRLRRLARPAGAAAQGGQLLPAAAAPLRRASSTSAPTSTSRSRSTARSGCSG